MLFIKIVCGKISEIGKFWFENILKNRNSLLNVSYLLIFLEKLFNFVMCHIHKRITALWTFLDYLTFTWLKLFSNARWLQQNSLTYLLTKVKEIWKYDYWNKNISNDFFLFVFFPCKRYTIRIWRSHKLPIYHFPSKIGE